MPGGTQALQRSERVSVPYGGRDGVIARPTLLGSIVGKACAVDVDDVPRNQDLDLALLLSLVEDPFVLRDELTGKDRQRLRRRSAMTDPSHRIWRSFDDEAASNAIAALRILVTKRQPGSSPVCCPGSRRPSTTGVPSWMCRPRHRDYRSPRPLMTCRCLRGCLDVRSTGCLRAQRIL